MTTYKNLKYSGINKVATNNQSDGLEGVQESKAE